MDWIDQCINKLVEDYSLIFDNPIESTFFDNQQIELNSAFSEFINEVETYNDLEEIQEELQNLIVKFQITT